MVLRAIGLFVVMIGMIASEASAACVCRCVNGVMQPLCSSTLDLPPLCPPTLCPLVPPSIAPIPSPMIPLIGTTRCSPQQVYNQFKLRYEWQTVCR